MAGISISLPPDLESAILKIAYDERKSKSEVVRDALIPYVQKKEAETTKQRRRR